MSRIVPSTELGPILPAPQVPFDAADKIRLMAPDAIDRLDQLMWNTRNPNVALKAVEMVLDRVVPRETKHTENRNIRITLDKGEEAGARLAMQEADIIDVTAEIV